MISRVMHLTYHWQDDKAANGNLSCSGAAYWEHTEHVLVYYPLQFYLASQHFPEVDFI